MEFNKIILPVDGSKEAKKAAKKAIFLAKHIGVEIVAMYVIDDTILNRYPFPDDILTPNLAELLKREGKEALDEVEKMAKKEGVKIKKKIVEGIPDEEIIKEARKNDLIVMGSKGKTALDRILLGSVSEKVVHHAPCPVMIVREEKRK